MEIQESNTGIVEIAGSRTELANAMNEAANKYHIAELEAKKQLFELPITDLQEIAFILEDMSDIILDITESEETLQSLASEAEDALGAMLDRTKMTNLVQQVPIQIPKK